MNMNMNGGGGGDRSVVGRVCLIGGCVCGYCSVQRANFRLAASWRSWHCRIFAWLLLGTGLGRSWRAPTSLNVQ